MTTSSDPRFSMPEQPTVLDVEARAGAAGQTLEPGQHVGPYRIERLLGEGGMGAVYLAEQLEPIQRPVALKLIRGQLRGGLAEAYFLVERQALARMDHPAIAKVFDAGTTPQGHLFFAMEWIDGATLAAFLAHDPLPLRAKLALFMRICMGVQHAHQKGVIHRDLKPGNVLVTTIDGQPMPKIIDFGVAMGTGSGAASPHAANQSIGTRGYMSPEQMRGKAGEVDIRSDVYALGVIFLEQLAPPATIEAAAKSGLDNQALHAALLASLGRNATANAEIARGLAAIPEPLRWMLVRATEADKALRYESAQALSDDIDRFLRDHPLRAAPSTRTYRLRCFVARNRGTIAATALVGIALVAGTSAAVVGMLRARAAAERARVEAIKSEQATAFLSDVLTGIDPGQARDMDKTLLNLVLDRAAKRASSELVDQPEVLATIEDTIGVTYNGLGEYDKAIAHTQRAYAAARASLGETDPQTLKIQRHLARQLDNTGKLKEVDAILAGNVAAFTRTRGADDPDTLRSELDLIQNMTYQGRYEEAERRLAARLPVIRRIGAKDVDLLVQGLEEQAMVLTYLGRYDEAEPIFKDVVARETRQWGAEATRTLDTLNEMSIMYGESHRYAQSEAILVKLLPIEEKLYGKDSAVTLTVVANLAGSLRQQHTPDKVAASGPYYLRAYEGMRRKFGDKHPDVIMATGNYGNYLLETGDVKGAIEKERTALAGSIDLFGAKDPVTAEMRFQLGRALLADHQYAEAEPHLLAAVEQNRKDLGAKHWKLGGYIDPLVELYRAWNKPDEAATWVRARDSLDPKPRGAM